MTRRTSAGKGMTYMARRRVGTNGPTPHDELTSEPFSPAELIVVARPEAGLRARAGGIETAARADARSLESILGKHGAALQPLFGEPEDRLLARASVDHGPAQPGSPRALARYYHVEAPDAELDELAQDLLANDAIEAAYVKPPTTLAVMTMDAPAANKVAEKLTTLNDMQPSAADAPPVTPDFTASQQYLDYAPAGVDARYAWTLPGGGGAGVRVIDCEWSWNLSHEDLLTNSGGVVVGAAAGNTNHGTAVMGEIGGDRNTTGISGIAPDAVLSAAAFSIPSAQAIRQAADKLGPGDIILLEIHRQGPGANGQGQDGYIAIEWWPDDFDAIRYATNKGVIVVEAAGNGFRNLDDPIYSVRPPNFPADWTNPFNRANRDSGAIVVGAGAPPPGTHGRNWGPDRSRLDFSNYGALVDAQGWGREVTTAGYGDLQAGLTNQWYTEQFSGTSSASPIVVGAIASVQGVLKARGRIPLTPARARDLLRATGSPQTDGPNGPATQRIGKRPDLRQLIPLAVQQGYWIGVQFIGTLQPNQTQQWFTFNWPAHWHVDWTVMPIGPQPGGPQLGLTVRVERANDRYATYWLTVQNLTNRIVTFEGRFRTGLRFERPAHRAPRQDQAKAQPGQQSTPALHQWRCSPRSAIQRSRPLSPTSWLPVRRYPLRREEAPSMPVASPPTSPTRWTRWGHAIRRDSQGPASSRRC
jgi:subtilase family protein